VLGENVSAEFGVAVHRETEGNPFFVEEVLKALIERGSVRRESGRWQRCNMGELVIPQSVKEAIGSRLDRITEQSNEVLRTAAVLCDFSASKSSGSRPQQFDDVAGRLTSPGAFN
jgi:predicted ATPase